MLLVFLLSCGNSPTSAFAVASISQNSHTIPENSDTYTELDVELYQRMQSLVDNACMNCHGNGVVAGRLDLSRGLCASTVYMEASGYTGYLVVPENPTQSILWHKCTDSGQYGAIMPTDQGLSADEIVVIEDWINNGATCPNEQNSHVDTNAVSECANVDEADQSNPNVENGYRIHDDICQYCHDNSSTPPLYSLIPVNSDDRIQEIVCKDSGFVAQFTDGITQQDFYDVLYVLRELYPE